jgi:hypothetical protein
VHATLARLQGAIAHVSAFHEMLPPHLPLPQLLLLQDYQLPLNVNATTSAAEAIAGAQFAIHAVPVQHTRAFLEGIKARMGRLGSVQGFLCWLHCPHCMLCAFLTGCPSRWHHFPPAGLASSQRSHHQRQQGH